MPSAEQSNTDNVLRKMYYDILTKQYDSKFERGIYRAFAVHNLIDYTNSGIKELDNYILRTKSYEYAYENDFKKNQKLTAIERGKAIIAMKKRFEEMISNSSQIGFGEMQMELNKIEKWLVNSYRLITKPDRDAINKELIESIKQNMSIGDNKKFAFKVYSEAMQIDDNRRDNPSNRVNKGDIIV